MSGTGAAGAAGAPPVCVPGAKQGSAQAGDTPPTADARPAAGADFTGVLHRLAERRDLTREEAAQALHQIVDGTVGEAQAAAFLMGLRVKGETAEEIAGLLETMRGLVVPVRTNGADVLVDIVGTGGDGLGTFNISTTAAFVVAGAGIKVAKHGNRAASSRCGSADLLEALGVRVDLTPGEVASCIERVGMGFMMAPLHHPAMGKVAGVRRALGVRTVFNLLGPLTNPAGVRRLLVGVGSPEYLEVLAGALARVGCEHALLVHGADGMDELSVTGPSTVMEVRDGEAAAPFTLGPEECGLERHELSALVGGDPAKNAAITRAVLAGAKGAPRDAVLLNAAAALYVAGVSPTVRQGVEMAVRSLDSGKAAGVLERLAAVSNERAGGGG